MNIYQKGKSRYITSAIDGKDYNLTTGHFKRHLDALGIMLADYFEKHEGIERTACQACGMPSAFFGYHPDDTVKWHSVCGDPACAKVMYSRAHLSRTPENWAAASEKRRKTFKEKPEVLAARTKIIHAANLRIGDDGLNGYERSAKKRANTLLKKYGRSDYANWEKTKHTWAEKPKEEVAAHGKKISDSWNSKTDKKKRDEISRREATKLEKYGKPGWKIAYDASSGRRSGVSDEFCRAVQALMPDTALVFGATEFQISNKFYDLTNHITRKIIEFNGDYWHANPAAYAPLRISGRNKKSAQEIWDADAAKIKLAEDAGYRVKVVWESEYRKNPKKIIEECIEWIKQ